MLSMIVAFARRLFRFPRVRGYAKLHGSVTIGRRPRQGR
jgi:hypothetical protein